MNNNNKDSRWYCFDVEWVKAFENQQQKNEAKFNGRFDIMAISKKKPQKVALIELKYGLPCNIRAGAADFGGRPTVISRKAFIFLPNGTDVLHTAIKRY